MAERLPVGQLSRLLLSPKHLRQHGLTKCESQGLHIQGWGHELQGQKHKNLIWSILRPISKPRLLGPSLDLSDQGQRQDLQVQSQGLDQSKGQGPTGSSRPKPDLADYTYEWPVCSLLACSDSSITSLSWMEPMHNIPLCEIYHTYPSATLQVQ